MISISDLTAMKPTKDRVFLDSNIVIYAHTDLDVAKKKLAQELISSSDQTYISTQVLQEVSNILSKKFKLSWVQVSKVIDQLAVYNVVHVNNVSTVTSAISVAVRYNYSFYYSLIIAASIECGCNIICSEDMHGGQKINGSLTIVSPFSE
jgi:predicted nucleic acid-binding protein